ncbi:MAG: hypothetical protein ACFFD2_06760 [Promethearchaeota archaeon]
MSQSPTTENKQSLLRNKSFLFETIYIVIILIITILILLDLVDTGFFLGPLRFSHWMGIIGAFFILIYAPLYYIMKRRFPNRYKILINIHIFGFTTSFLLVSIHFAGQLSRPLQFYPDIGGGLALYIIVTILVATGYLYRYHPIKLKSGKFPPHFNRALHAGLVGGLYIVLIVHTVLNFFL